MATATTTTRSKARSRATTFEDQTVHLGPLFQALDLSGAKRAIKILAADRVLTATRLGTRKTHGRSRSTSFVLTVGKPNYRVRAFIKQCQQAGEPIPVKKVQLRGTW